MSWDRYGGEMIFEIFENKYKQQWMLFFFTIKWNMLVENDFAVIIWRCVKIITGYVVAIISVKCD